jgi:hypothetical protein
VAARRKNCSKYIFFCKIPWREGYFGYLGRDEIKIRAQHRDQHKGFRFFPFGSTLSEIFQKFKS